MTARAAIAADSQSLLRDIDPQRHPGRPNTSSTVRFGPNQVTHISPRHETNEPRRDTSAPTPGVDDSPYIRFAIDQLTRDEEVSGAGRQGSVISVDYPVERIVRDEGLGYYHHTGAKYDETTKPSERQSEKRASEAVFVAVEPEAGDHRYPSLDYVPLVLRPWALGIFIFLILWMIAGVAFCNAWSQRKQGIWDYNGVGGSRYFVVQYLPQFLGGLLVVWNFVIQAAIYRTIPFSILASERHTFHVLQNLSVLSRNHLVPDLSHFRCREPIIGFSLLTMWLVNVFTMPLLSCLFQTKFYGNGGQGVWRWTSVQAVGWTIIAIYALLVIALVFLIFRFLRSWTGLIWDPVSLADLIPLIQRSNILRDYDGFETSPNTRHGLAPRVLRLGYWKLMDKEEIFYGIGQGHVTGDAALHQSPRMQEKRPSDSSHAAVEDLEQQSMLRKESFERSLHSPFIRYRWTVWFLRDSFVLAWVIIILILFIAFVAVSFAKDAIRRGFMPLLSTMPSPNGFSASNFLYSFIPSLIGTILFLLWQPIDVYFRALQPFASMSSPVGASAESSLLLSYPACLPFEATFLASVHKHYKVAFISLMSILSLAIPVLAGGVFIALWYPSQSEVRITSDLPAYYVLVAFCALYTLAFLLIWPRRHRYLPHDISTLADLISFLYRSPLLEDQLLRQPRSKTDLVTRLMVTPPGERNEPLYGFGIYKGLDWKDHLGIDRLYRPERADMLIMTGTMKG